MSSFVTDTHYMNLALRLGRRNLGQTRPNPCVGCVIVCGNEIIGRGVTAKGGRPHAEALALAGTAARGATVYITLEPCAHHGKTPPCVEALIAAGISRAVIAIEDPDPRVAGKGIAGLREAGIAVTLGVCAEEAANDHAGFFQRVKTGLPAVTLKLATTRNGFMTRDSERWITGDLARQHGHLLRARHDAILVGIGTVLADDPLLNCRLAGQEGRDPVRVILDRDLRLPPESRVAQTAGQYRTIVFTKHRARTIPNIEIVSYDGTIENALQKLGGMGFTRVLAEGGYRVAQSLIEENLADTIYWYRAPLSASPLKARHNVCDLGLRNSPIFLDYGLSAARSIGADELRVYKRGQGCLQESSSIKAMSSASPKPRIGGWWSKPLSWICQKLKSAIR